MIKKFTPLPYTFNDWRKLSNKVRFREQKIFYEANKEYISKHLREKKWVIILASSGTIYSAGDYMDTFPSTKEILRIANETNEFPATYSSPPKIEEIFLKAA